MTFVSTGNLNLPIKKILKSASENSAMFTPYIPKYAFCTSLLPSNFFELPSILNEPASRI